MIICWRAWTALWRRAELDLTIGTGQRLFLTGEAYRVERHLGGFGFYDDRSAACAKAAQFQTIAPQETKFRS